MSATTAEVTKLLNAAALGNAKSTDELLGLIYEELRCLARARLRQCAPGATLQPTELVHEAYLRLFGNGDVAEPGCPTSATWNSRGHFFTAAAQAMRNILVEQARRRASLKRGGRWKRVSDGKLELIIEPPSEDMLQLDDLLRHLERSDPRKAKLVLLHCFSGLTLEETAVVMDVSLTTIEREWRFTRALLRSKLDERGTPELR